jgi:hypothetical protein
LAGMFLMTFVQSWCQDRNRAHDEIPLSNDPGGATTPY